MSSPDGGLSPEARAFLAAIEPSSPVDPTRMDEIRAETRAGFTPASERAVERFDLQLAVETIGGVECDVVRSGGRADGTTLYVFGGAFIVGDPWSDLPIIGALAAGTGTEVVAPRYRLAPEHPAPAASHDIAAVHDALVALGRIPDVISGESAGGNLALLAAQRAVATGLPMPAALALLSPAVDLRTDADLFEPVLDSDPTLTLDRVVDVDALYVAGADQRDPMISPLFGAMEGLPPTIVTTGTRDLLMPMCLRLDRRMRRAGVDVDTRVWDGLWHVFEYYDEYPEAAESLDEVVAFVERHRPHRSSESP